MNIIDLRMNKIYSTINIYNDEVTSVAINESENSLVVGCRDGVVKIYNIDKDYELRE